MIFSHEYGTNLVHCGYEKKPHCVRSSLLSDIIPARSIALLINRLARFAHSSLAYIIAWLRLTHLLIQM